MKRWLLLLVAVMVLGLAVPVGATLLDRGGGLIYDDDRNITWLQDAGLSGLRNWDDAVAWADNLVFAGFDDWRLPSALNEDGSGPCLGFNCTGSEMGHLYYTELGNVASGGLNSGPFLNLGVIYWSGTEIAANPAAAYLFIFNLGLPDAGFAGNNPKEFLADALAVRTGDVSAPVPEPTTMLLLSSGLVGLAGYGRKKLFKK